MITRILVIDDEAPLLVMVKQMLEKAGYTTTAVNDGEAGLKFVSQNPIDLVITDIFMPDKDGLGTILELRAQFPHIKIIAISGGSRRGPDYLLIAKKLGAQHVLAKPFERQELLDVVAGVLSQRE